MSNPYLEQWTSKEMLKELEEGILNAPQDLLGCHIFKEEDVQILPHIVRVQNVCGCWIQRGDHLRDGTNGAGRIFGYVIEKKSERLKNIDSGWNMDRTM